MRAGGTLRRLMSMTRVLASLGVGLAVLLVASPTAAIAKGGRDEVRVAGVCGSGALAELRLKRRDDGIELRFGVDRRGAGAVWRIVLVHERRIAWRGVRRTGQNGSFEVRWMLEDLSGADAVTARAWGPRGLVCRASATLPASQPR